ncbi:MAG: DUF421 domain-containing protein [Anaerolineae bacterium]|nr:DUF421 domain-containing protein [Gemmatimonadaceae bacterium]
MDSVMRAVAVYLFLLAIFRLAGKRSLANITTFDLVLTLIISESIQQSLTGKDSSMTNALLLITTFVGLDIILSLLKHRSRGVDRLLDGVPLVLIRAGEMLQERLNKERVDKQEILTAARLQRGTTRLEDIDYAVLEPGGQISVIAKEGAAQ